jgi:hypothetical protein
VITPRPNHGRSVKWIDSGERKVRPTSAGAGIGDVRNNKASTGRNDSAKETTQWAPNLSRPVARNQPYARPTPVDVNSAQKLRPGVARPEKLRPTRDNIEARDDKKGLHEQSMGGGARDEPPRRDPPGLDADILRGLRKKRDPVLSARERKQLSMHQRKAQLNLSVLDVNHSDSMSAPQGVLFDDEGYPISEVSEESSYYPSRLQQVRSSEKKRLTRFRPPSKSTPGKDPPTNIGSESPRRQSLSQEKGPAQKEQMAPSNPGERANVLVKHDADHKALLDEAAAQIVRSPSPDAYSSNLCGFGPPTALKGDGVRSPFSMLDGCRPCDSIILEPLDMKGDLEDETVTLAPSEGNSAGLAFDGPADEIWMAGRDERKSKRKWLRRPKTILGCGADQDQQIEPDSLLTPTRRYIWSRGRSFDSTELHEVPSWHVVENPSMPSTNFSTDGSRPISPARRTRGRSTRARSPSPAAVNESGSYDEYKTPLQRLRSLGRRLSRSQSPGRSMSPAPSRGRSNSPGLQHPVGRRGRSESPFGRRERSESPANRRKVVQRSEQDKMRARNKPLFVNTTTTPQSSVFSNLTSSRYYSPGASRGTDSQRSDGALVSGVGELSYDDERDLKLNNYGLSRGAGPSRAGLPPKSPARVSQYGAQRAIDEEREVPEPSRAGLFGRMMRRNRDVRSVRNDESWASDSQPYSHDDYNL